MAVVTRQDIMTKFEDLYSPGTHVSYEFTADNEGNVTQTEIQILNEISAELRVILEFLVDAILIEINDKGIEMGDSTATKMEVE